MKEKSKAACYVRISTGEQSHFSLQAQQGEIKKYCQEHDLEIYKFYSDSLSGLKFEEREGLQKLLDDGEKKLYDILLITEMDRLARDTNIIGYIKLTLEMNKIKIIAINEPEAKTEYDELISGIIALFSSFETKRRKRRCIRGIAKAKEDGKVMHRVPKGYKVINAGTKESQVLIDEPEAAIIKEIFNKRLKSISMYKIGRETGLNRATIKYILANRFYCDSEYKGKHEPIISEEIFNKINNKV